MIPPQYPHESWIYFLWLWHLSAVDCWYLSWGFLPFQIADSSRTGTVPSSTSTYYSAWCIIGSQCKLLNVWMDQWVNKLMFPFCSSLVGPFVEQWLHHKASNFKSCPSPERRDIWSRVHLAPPIVLLMYFSLSRTCVCDIVKAGPQSVASVRC